MISNISKKVILVLIPFILVFGIASIISYSYFGVVNPIASSIGLIKVNITDTQFLSVQKSPQVIFFKPNSNIIKIMEENGYSFLENEEMGAMKAFEKDGIKYYGSADHGRISFLRMRTK